jgi:hypothetical protein
MGQAYYALSDNPKDTLIPRRVYFQPDLSVNRHPLCYFHQV